MRLGIENVEKDAHMDGEGLLESSVGSSDGIRTMSRYLDYSVRRGVTELKCV